MEIPRDKLDQNTSEVLQVALFLCEAFVFRLLFQSSKCSCRRLQGWTQKYGKYIKMIFWEVIADNWIVINKDLWWSSK